MHIRVDIFVSALVQTVCCPSGENGKSVKILQITRIIFFNPEKICEVC